MTEFKSRLLRLADGKTTHRDMIIDKISSLLSATNDAYYQQLTDMLDSAKRIFISGAGRSGLVGKFLVQLQETAFKLTDIGFV